MLHLTYPTRGRGAWNTAGVGGTLSSDGTTAGKYYRAPAVGSHLAMPGYVGRKLVDASAPLDINYFAVYMAIRAIQGEIGAAVDGLFGPQTANQLASWQAEHQLNADGVFGPASARTMFGAIGTAVAKQVSSSPLVGELIIGHVSVESGWDPGAIGVTTPRDLGLGQINGDAHPDLGPAFRLTPRLALPAVANFMLADCEAMLWNTRDAIAAYNLGVTGARSWIKAGRPAVYLGAPIGKYVDAVVAAMA